jgi:hypothetical protein
LQSAPHRQPRRDPPTGCARRSAPRSLTANVAGAFDVSTGAFHETLQSITGTGLLRWVTGQVTIHGLENLTIGSFTETLAGRL